MNDRQTDTERKRQTDKDWESQKELEGEIYRPTERERERERDRQTDRQTERGVNRGDLMYNWCKFRLRIAQSGRISSAAFKGGWASAASGAHRSITLSDQFVTPSPRPNLHRNIGRGMAFTKNSCLFFYAFTERRICGCRDMRALTQMGEEGGRGREKEIG